MRTLTLSALIFLSLAGSSSSQEEIIVPPRPTEIEPKSPEQIRKEWNTICSKARLDAVDILKKTQGRNGAWVTLPERWGEATSPLVIEALLDSNVAISDPVIVKGLKNLRSYSPETTDAGAMQTVALCKANDPRDRKIIERNVAWLLRAAKRDEDRLLGWGRSDELSARGVFESCSFFAMMALRSACRAGFTVESKIWSEIRDLYLRDQRHDGGWASWSRLPTVVALYGLHVVEEQLGWSAQTNRSMEAIRKGIEHLVEFPSFTDLEATHFLYALSRLGSLYRDSKFAGANGKKRDWYEDGMIWIINHQMPSGTVFLPRFDQAKTTASALLFMATGK